MDFWGFEHICWSLLTFWKRFYDFASTTPLQSALESPSEAPELTFMMLDKLKKV